MADSRSLGMKVERTYWNGEPCKARRVQVVVADAPEFPRYWARDLVGRQVEAVEISEANQAGTQPFYLFNDGECAGQAWRKVTEGKGSPRWGHRDLRISHVVPASTATNEAQDG